MYSNLSVYLQFYLQVTGNDTPKPIESFEKSGLCEFLITNIEKSGYTQPTPIQKNAIPAICAGRDIMACAQTGSGKTAAFLLPIMENLLSQNVTLTIGQPNVVIVSPTRELTIQVNF